ncbi:hypothetical protein MDA_GLEAN10026202 [Myotis davidii]|uniref:Uncharacterized protein n=1 Tax=Myotis davidii TaxID=225400 RepID=L5M362_MYODS|nr:hypothetical protein MDA_GLEAN10026202 [Myotis davidii]
MSAAHTANPGPMGRNPGCDPGLLTPGSSSLLPAASRCPQAVQCRHRTCIADPRGWECCSTPVEAENFHPREVPREASGAAVVPAAWEASSDTEGCSPSVLIDSELKYDPF